MNKSNANTNNNMMRDIDFLDIKSKIEILFNDYILIENAKLCSFYIKNEQKFKYFSFNNLITENVKGISLNINNIINLCFLKRESYSVMIKKTIKPGYDGIISDDSNPSVNKRAKHSYDDKQINTKDLRVIDNLSIKEFDKLFTIGMENTKPYIDMQFKKYILIILDLCKTSKLKNYNVMYYIINIYLQIFIHILSTIDRHINLITIDKSYFNQNNVLFDLKLDDFNVGEFNSSILDSIYTYCRGYLSLFTMILNKIISNGSENAFYKISKIYNQCAFLNIQFIFNPHYFSDSYLLYDYSMNQQINQNQMISQRSPIIIHANNQLPNNNWNLNNKCFSDHFRFTNIFVIDNIQCNRYLIGFINMKDSINIQKEFSMIYIQYIFDLEKKIITSERECAEIYIILRGLYLLNISMPRINIDSLITLSKISWNFSIGTNYSRSIFYICSILFNIIMYILINFKLLSFSYKKEQIIELIATIYSSYYNNSILASYYGNDFSEKNDSFSVIILLMIIFPETLNKVTTHHTKKYFIISDYRVEMDKLIILQKNKSEVLKNLNNIYLNFFSQGDNVMDPCYFNILNQNCLILSKPFSIQYSEYYNFQIIKPHKWITKNVSNQHDIIYHCNLNYLSKFSGYFEKQMLYNQSIGKELIRYDIPDHINVKLFEYILINIYTGCKILVKKSISQTEISTNNNNLNNNLNEFQQIKPKLDSLYNEQYYQLSKSNQNEINNWMLNYPKLNIFVTIEEAFEILEIAKYLDLKYNICDMILIQFVHDDLIDQSNVIYIINNIKKIKEYNRLHNSILKYCYIVFIQLIIANENKFKEADLKKFPFIIPYIDHLLYGGLELFDETRLVNYSN